MLWRSLLPTLLYVTLASPDETLRRVAHAARAEGRTRRRRAAEDGGRVGGVAPAEAAYARGRAAVAAHRRVAGGATVCGRFAAERNKHRALGFEKNSSSTHLTSSGMARYGASPVACICLPRFVRSSKTLDCVTIAVRSV